MSARKEAHIEDVLKRLDIIICLLLRRSEEMTVRQMISQLNEMGLRNSEIARILNKSPKYISKELSLLKKSSKKT